MDSKIKHLKNSQVEAIIKVDPKEFTEWKEKAFQKLAEQSNIPGFRKGKVPSEMVKEKIGEHAILAEVLDLALPKWYLELCKEHSLQPISDVQPDIISTDPLELKITFSIWPEVKLTDPSKTKVKKTEVKLSDADIDKEIQAILDQNVDWIEVARAAQSGDKVELDFEGFNEQGESLPNAKSEHHPLIIGSGTMIPGFEENIVGLKQNDRHEFEITFPEDYHSEQMKGKKAKFKTRIHYIFEKKVPDFNDEFVTKLTQDKIKKTDDLRKEIEIAMKAQREKMAQQQYEADIISQFAEKSRVETPEILIERVLDQMIQNFRQDIEGRGLTWDQYLEHHKIKIEDMRDKWRESAEKRAREEIVLQAYADQEKITVSDEDIDKEIKLITNNIPEKQQKEAIDHYTQPGARDNIRTGLRLRRTIEKLISIQK